MNNRLYRKLAVTNMRKNSQIYIPYLLGGITIVIMFYIMTSLSQDKTYEGTTTGYFLSAIMTMGAIVIGIFSVIFLFYTNSFLMKRRKKEFGLYTILGMEKRHISKIMLYETIFISIISISIGLVLGIVFHKLCFLFLEKLIQSPRTMGFSISLASVVITIIIFVFIYSMTLLYNLRQIHLTNPIDLLKGGQLGEKEPKTKWFMTIVGFLSIGIGYYLALTSGNPLGALSKFFIAVIFVIVGTYNLFTSASITILKLLRKNKKLYYQTKNFISISGMIHRMKQNALSLSNICILSTAILIMISGTISLYLGIDDAVTTMYPQNIAITSAIENSKNMITTVDDALKSNNVDVQNKISYSYLEFVVEKNTDGFIISKASDSTEYENLISLHFILLDDYSNITGNTHSINNDEVIIYSENKSLLDNVIKIGDMEFSIVNKLDNFPFQGLRKAYVTMPIDSVTIIVKDMDVLKKLEQMNIEVYKENASVIKQYYGFDLKDNVNNNIITSNNISQKLTDNNVNARLDSRDKSYSEIYEMYGGFLFLGIFLGLLFIVATVMIIYYKQVSEGYEDRKRFEIMLNVGLGHDEIKKTIHSQILFTYILPIITAGIHVLAAFKSITLLLAILNLYNVQLFAICSVITFVVFIFLYILIYRLTAKVYYKIVSQNSQKY